MHIGLTEIWDRAAFADNTGLEAVDARVLLYAFLRRHAIAGPDVSIRMYDQGLLFWQSPPRHHWVRRGL